MRIARVLNPVLLERAEIVGVSELGPQLLEDIPVEHRPLGSKGVIQVPPEVTLYSIAIEEGVINIEQEDKVVGCCHGATSCTRGSCQPPSPPTSALASCGPQVFGA